jgi:hypothetical protein
MKWANAECLRRNKMITKEILKEILDPILKHIRFPVMDIKEFATVVGLFFFFLVIFIMRNILVAERLLSVVEEHGIMEQIATGEPPTKSMARYNSVPRESISLYIII